MNRRTLVEFIIAWFLVLCGSITLLLPLFNISDVKVVFVVILSIYAIIHLIKYLLIIKTKDYTGLFIFLSSLIAIVLSFILKIKDSPWNLALVTFIWIILNSFIKLKESDYYHDRKNRLWALNVVNLVLFILIGILTTVNLYYDSFVQILVLGFFFLANGILELMDPLVAYILEKR